MIDRRILVASTAGLFGFAALRWLRGEPAKAAEKFEIEKTDAEWRAQLTPQQYDILRKEGTERPFTSPLLKEHRKGIFACAGCGFRSMRYGLSDEMNRFLRARGRLYNYRLCCLVDGLNRSYHGSRHIVGSHRLEKHR